MSMSVHMPVVPTQQVFRQLLMSMSHPGRLYAVDCVEFETLLQAVTRTLFDHEVSFHTLHDTDGWGELIFADTKAKKESLQAADYVIVNGHSSGGAVYDVKPAEPEFPDTSATVIYVMDAPLECECSVELSGPGIRQTCTPEMNVLAKEEWQALMEINSEYPLGIDVICLVEGRGVLSVPRSSRITIG